ncbi:FHA domain-containing protein [Brachybacterium sp. JHP9]|uniref:FHA domain-containing protein n=1 Tax=Brachybacterium equifaecis TaxID=2910770 RepID=A0ABT0QXU4_9MICO|nr:FHA domain-containing protein [Brachybacterium equifaecis]
MGILDRIERGLDRGVTSVFAPGRGHLKPLDLAQGLKRECDDQIQVLDRTRTIAPNVFTIYLNSADHERFASWEDTLREEMERVILEHAEKNRYVFVGGVSVQLERDDEVREGRFETESRTERGAVAPATAGEAAGPSGHPIVEIDDQQYLLTGPVTVIGRGGDADIILDDTGVSRHHLELRVADGALQATDLGSTNGTFVDGERIRTPVTLQDRSTLKIGRTLLTVILPQSPAAQW